MALSLVDYCLLTLALIYDALDNVPTNKATAMMLGLSSYDQPRRRTAVNKALAYLAKKDYIRKRENERQNLWQITPLGRQKIREDYHLLWYREQKWDGKWRLCLFDVPEKDKKLRYAMRRRLKEWGFVMLQKSVWLSPFPFADRLTELFREAGLTKKYLLLTTYHLPADQEKRLAWSLWHLAELDRAYRALVASYKKATTPAKRFAWRRRYLAVYSRDPQLPERLLPNDWLGQKVMACSRNLGGLASG